MHNYRGQRGQAPAGRRGQWGRTRGGGRGRGGGRSNTEDAAPQRVCPQYMQHRTCRYGADCRFSHDVPEFTAEEEDAHEAYLDWKRQLRQMALLTGNHSALWTDALAILEGDAYREWQQSVARDLADDDIGGLIRIRGTVQFCMDNLKDNTQAFRVATPFLKVLTHHSLCDSLSVDVYVGKIYRYFGGINGETAILFLSDLARRSLSMLEQEASPPAWWEPDTTCTLLLKCLLGLVRRERKALLNDDLPKLFQDLQKLVALLQQKVRFGPAIDRCTSCLDTMKRLMESATLLLGDPDGLLPEQRGRSGRVRLTFPMDVHVPGGSHDNDNADISKIQILPTHGEIISKHPEYLPTTDFSQAHFLQDPVRRHIDTAFRLLRHDTFGPLKDALNRFLADDDKPTSNSHQLMDNNIRAHVYDRAQIQRVFVRPRTGLEAILSFATPHQLRNSSPADRRRWWQESSRLEPGALACYVSHDEGKKRSLFFIVTHKSTEERNDDPQKSTLVSKHSDPTVTVKLATESQECLALLIRLHTSKHSGVLVDLPGIIPDTFVPVLTNLQRIMTDGELPFSQWILPAHGSLGERPQQLTIPPPAYARKKGFVFKLDSITSEKSGPLRLNPSTSHEDINLDKFEKSTGLNRSQCRALITALTREYALIQGPPGTGKSYVGVQLVRTLLSHKKEASLGPILIICYTNHALDQFLMHLLNCGIEKIIRIGGQSRCEELDGKNLRVVSSGIGKSTVENRVLGEAFNKVEEYLSTAGHCLKPLHLARKGRPNRELLSRYLSRRYPMIWRQFPEDGKDEEGFTRVGGDSVQLWLGKRPPQESFEGVRTVPNRHIDLIIRRAERDVQSLDPVQRWILIEFWIKEMIDQQTGVLFESIDGAKTYRQRIDGVHADVNRRAVMQADVVGVTTTGLARNIDMLRRIGSKVIMCEEAAEVMEPHLISAMMPGVEHLIQIGDHQQLRPQIQNYLQFSMETQAGLSYQLDRSQFERRAVGEPGLAPLPVAQLNAQRRMRPEISRLIRRIYPKLEDHPSVLSLPDVVGMRKNLFWFDHEHPEDSKDGGARVQSYSNAWEVEMATALVRHVVRQGEYSSSDIALLTPYTGQLQKLRAALSKDFEVFLSDRDMEKMALDGFSDDAAKDIDPTSHKTVEKKALLQTIRLATVDNFQGEEAKVIIVSLVRSNMNCKVGFLRTENRINVLLSRAQHGMYLIGNSRTYRNVAMWANVHEQMTEMDATDDRVDLLEFKTYEEIDLNETPIVVLGCGHFFTAETLDGLVGMHEVYTTDKTGRYNGLKDLSVLANAVPSCPDCKRPIRQFAAKRYNRVINRAVMDETSKRFLTSGRQQLTQLEKRLESLEKTLERNREAFKTGPKRDLKKRWEATAKLAKEAKLLSRDMKLEHQPAKKLLDAVLTFQLKRRAAESLEQAMDNLNIDSGPASLPTSAPAYDQQITLGAEMAYIKAEEVILQDAFNLSQNLRDAALEVLKSCKHVVTAASDAKLPRLVIEASLSYGRIVQLHERSRHKHRNATQDENGAEQKKEDEAKEQEEEDRVDTAKKFLGDALALCDTLPNTEAEREAIEGTLRLFTTEWYEEVTPEELAAIKTAMFAIGECGMPMELARCPECNAPIGGQNHMAVGGVTRAENFERA
ncbi:hypothetical protein N0V85_004010 [Neurospora sp. IMI 360204]|nr:hypothetical protein N0V85_004010 [Neurospora sp. IMI 360204]